MSIDQLNLPGLTPGVRQNTNTCPHCAGLGTLTATDSFCGAGGSSLGLEWVRCPACGRSLIQVTQAFNHWDLAVEAHNTNFPHTDHDVQTASAIPPSRFKRTDIFWASPECTHHAYCRGEKDQSADAVRSRATFVDIIRFTAHHRYDAVIVENVVEARLWCDQPGHGDRCSCGATFDTWFRQMTDLGYDGEIVYFNSQFAPPTPQSRDRMYPVFWRRGIKRPNLDFTPLAWCSHCSTVVRGIQTWKKAARGSVRSRPGLFRWGRYGTQYLYHCPTCAHPVAPAVTGAKTIIDRSIPMQRIGDRSQDLAAPTRKRIGGGLTYIATLDPPSVPVGGRIYDRNGRAQVWAVDPDVAIGGQPMAGLITPAGGQSAAARSIDEPSHTIIGTDRLAVTLRVGGQSPVPTVLGEPQGTVTAQDRQRAVVVPVGGQTGSARTPRSTDEPLTTVTTANHRAVVVPNMAHNTGRSTAEPAPTVTTGNRHMLVQVTHAGDRRARAVEEPTPTIAGHGELGIVTMRQNSTPVALDEPATTVCGGGYHHGLLAYNGTPGFIRSLDDAAGTVTTRDKQALLVPYNRTGTARTVEEPTGTLTTRDREAYVVTDADIDACYFRMLQWPELLRAQVMHVLPDGSPYLLSARRRNHRGKFVELSNELRTKMIGNAVSSPVATMLGYSVMQALAA